MLLPSSEPGSLPRCSSRGFARMRASCRVAFILAFPYCFPPNVLLFCRDIASMKCLKITSDFMLFKVLNVFEPCKFHSAESRKDLDFFVNWDKQLMILKFFSSPIKFSLGTEHSSGSVLYYVLNNTFTIAVVQLFSSL